MPRSRVYQRRLLAELRKKAGYSQRAFARAMGIPKSCYNRIEAGGRCDVSLANEIASHLGSKLGRRVAVEKLFGDPGQGSSCNVPDRDERTKLDRAGGDDLADACAPTQTEDAQAAVREFAAAGAALHQGAGADG